MKTIHDLIKKLEDAKYNNPTVDIEEGFDNGINHACNEIEMFFGMYEQLGGNLSVRTQKACVFWLMDNGFLENVNIKDVIWREGIALNRYHLEMILKYKRTVRNLGSKGIQEIEKALKTLRR